MYNSNKKLLVNILMLIIGVIAFMLSLSDVTDSTLLGGFGGGIIGIEILQIIKNIKYRNDKDYKEMIDTECSDERNKYLRLRAWAYTGYTSLLLFAVATVVTLFLNLEIYIKIFSYAVSLMLAIFVIYYMILNKKY